MWAPLPGTLFSFSLPLALALTFPWLSSSGVGTPPWAPSPLRASLGDEATEGRNLLPRSQLHPRTGPWPSDWAGAGPTFLHILFFYGDSSECDKWSLGSSWGQGGSTSWYLSSRSGELRPKALVHGDPLTSSLLVPSFSLPPAPTSSSQLPKLSTVTHDS